MSLRSACRSGLVVFFLVGFVFGWGSLFCFVAWALCWKLDILLSLLLVVVDVGRFFLYPGPGGLQNRSLKYCFCCFFVSFLFVLCRFGRFGVQAWFVQIDFAVFAVWQIPSTLNEVFFRLLGFRPSSLLLVFFLCFWGLCLGAGFLRFLGFGIFGLPGTAKPYCF